MASQSKLVAMVMSFILFGLSTFQPIFHDLAHYFQGTVHVDSFEQPRLNPQNGEVKVPYVECELLRIYSALNIEKTFTFFIALCLLFTLGEIYRGLTFRNSQSIPRRYYFLPLSCGPPQLA